MHSKLMNCQYVMGNHSIALATIVKIICKAYQHLNNGYETILSSMLINNNWSFIQSDHDLLNFILLYVSYHHGQITAQLLNCEEITSHFYTEYVSLTNI